MRSIPEILKYHEVKWRLRKFSDSKDSATEIERIEDLIVNSFQKVEVVEVVNSEKLFLSDKSIEISRRKKDQVSLLRRTLKTRGRLRWLCFHFMKEIFNDAYEISRGRLIFRLLINRSLFRDSILDKLCILRVKPEESQTISIYKYTHPDTGFIYEKNYSYLLEDNLNASLVFRKKASSSLLESLILWNSSRVLYLLQSSSTLIEVPQVQSLLNRYPDLIDQYNSLERFSVVFHEHSTRTLDVRNGLLSSGPDFLLNVDIWHQRFIIQDKKWILADVTGSPYTKFVAGHWQFLEQRNNEGADVFIKKPSSIAVSKLKAAIYLMGRADENWYHLLLDTLPRYLILKEIDKSVPVLIRSDLPKTSLHFLSLILDREIIYVKPDDVVSVGKLFFVASRSTVFDSKPPKNIEQVEFPSGIYRDLQRYILGKLPEKKLANYPKNLYLPRRSKYRSLLNESHVSKIASHSDFAVVDTNVDFYRQQYFFFNQAETVLSPGGAVLANIIFMQPGSRVMSIRSWRDSDLLLWKKLADACDIRFVEAVGIPTYYGRNALARQHSNFYLPLRKIKKLIKSVV